MKKFLAFSAAILFAGALSFSIFAFTDDDPKKEKKETAVTEQCEKHKDAATAAGTEAKACCKKEGETASAGCTKAADGKTTECKHHTETTADAEVK